MEAEPTPVVDRVLHARAEVLLRRAVREDLARVRRQEQTPLVVVGFDRSRNQRWVAGADPELLAAITAELDPVAAGVLLVGARAATRDDAALHGIAVTATVAGARAFPLTARPRRLGRPKVTLGAQHDPEGGARTVALELLDVLDRAARLRR